MPDSTNIIVTPPQLCGPFAPLDSLVGFECQAPWSAAEQAVSVVGPVPYTQGIAGEPRKSLPGYDSGVMTLIIAVLLLVTFNFRHYSTFIKTFTQNLFSVRKRQNNFDPRSTVSETSILFSLLVLLCLCEGILMFSAASVHLRIEKVFPAVGLLSGLAAVYYIFQLVAYNTLGYVFTSSENRVLFLKGFNASQSLLAVALVVPAIVSLFNPEYSALLVSVAVFLYIVARIIFIIKGFRIFYKNSFSLLYFILYLCTLEIIPLILIYKATFYLIAII